MSTESETSKHRCFECASYDMWCGTCLNPTSKRFEDDEEYIADLKPCDKFEYSNPKERYD